MEELLNIHVYRFLGIEERLKKGYTINKQTGCWEWGKYHKIQLKHNTPTPKLMHPRIKVNGKSYRVSRLMYAMYYNTEIPKELYACHKCDNPICVNPEHIFLGTHKENMRDMVQKNRRHLTEGEAHPRSKISENDVREIRSKFGIVPTRELSKIYNMSRGNIHAIAKSITWKNVK